MIPFSASAHFLMTIDSHSRSFLISAFVAITTIGNCHKKMFIAQNVINIKQLFTEGEENIGEYLPSCRRGKYSPIITLPKANNNYYCLSIIIINSKTKKSLFWWVFKN